jgi:hypothetical protein
MESNRSDRVDPELVDTDPRPRNGSDPLLSGHADLSPWEHEVHPAAQARTRSGRGKLIAAVIATGVFLGTGFAIGAPVYALSRWWANRPVATATLETKSPVAAQAAGAPPANGALPLSAAAQSAIVVDEEVMFGAIAGDAGTTDAGVPDAMPQEIVAIPEPSVAPLASEPPAAGPLQSVPPVVVPPLVEPVIIDAVAIDPVAVERVTIDPVAIDRVTIDPVPVERVIIDPVAIDRVKIDPVQIHVPEVDGEQRRAR